MQKARGAVKDATTDTRRERLLLRQQFMRGFAVPRHKVAGEAILSSRRKDVGGNSVGNASRSISAACARSCPCIGRRA